MEKLKHAEVTDKILQTAYEPSWSGKGLFRVIREIRGRIANLGCPKGFLFSVPSVIQTSISFQPGMHPIK